MIIDPSTLRRAYRDTITTLPDTAMYRKTVDEGMAAEPCYLCTESWEIGQDAVKLRCECPHWTHEACLAKAAFETGGCPTCRTSMLAMDNETVLECAATDGDLSKVTSLLQQGIQPSPRGFAEWTPLLAAAKAGHQEIVRSWSFRVGARSISTDGVILGGERGASRDHSGASFTRGGPVQQT